MRFKLKKWIFMYKILFILLLLSCSKEPPSDCWTCKLDNGTVKEGCGPVPEFEDNNGNDLGCVCEYK